MVVAAQTRGAARACALVAAALFFVVTIPHGAALTSGLTFTTESPDGQGASTITVSYSLPQRAQVGSSLTVPLKLVVDNLTGVMAYLQGYNVTVRLSLSTGRSLSGTAGVPAGGPGGNGTVLHSGQSWGPVNVTIPLSVADTGLSDGQEALGNATLEVVAVAWLGEPPGSSTVVRSQGSMGYTLVAYGNPPGERPNLLGLALLGGGVATLLTAVALRKRAPREVVSEESGKGGKPPGAV